MNEDENKWERGNKVKLQDTGGDLWDDVDADLAFENLNVGLSDMSKASEDFRVEMEKLKKDAQMAARNEEAQVKKEQVVPTIHHAFPQAPPLANTTSMSEEREAQKSIFDLNHSSSSSLDGVGTFSTPGLSLPPSPPRSMPATPVPVPDKWFYLDPQANQQGPFRGAEMREWFDAGYFKPNLPVRCGTSGVFAPLATFENGNKTPFVQPGLDVFSDPQRQQQAHQQQEHQRQLELEQQRRLELQQREQQQREQQQRQMEEQRQMEKQRQMEHQRLVEQQRINQQRQHEQQMMERQRQMEQQHRQRSEPQLAPTSIWPTDTGKGPGLFGSIPSAFASQGPTQATTAPMRPEVREKPAASWATAPKASSTKSLKEIQQEEQVQAKAQEAQRKEFGSRPASTMSMAERLGGKSLKLPNNIVKASSDGQLLDMGEQLKLMLGVSPEPVPASNKAGWNKQPTNAQPTTAAGWNKQPTTAQPSTNAAGWNKTPSTSQPTSLRDILAEEERTQTKAPSGPAPSRGWSSIVAGGRGNSSRVPDRVRTTTPTVVKPSPVSEDATFWNSPSEVVVPAPVVKKETPTIGSSLSPEMQSWCVLQLKKVGHGEDLTLLQFLSGLDDPVEIRQYFAAYLVRFYCLCLLNILEFNILIGIDSIGVCFCY